VDPQSFNVGREFAGSLVEMVSGWQYNVLLAGQDVVPMHPDYRIAESSEYDRVKDFLSQRAPIGGTDLLAVFRWVAEIVPADGSTCIVYVGDGIDTLGRLEDAALVDAIARLFGGREVELSCVSIGASYDQLVLSGLAERLGGTFQPVTGVHDVFDAADGILGGFFCPVRRDVELGFEGVEVAALYPPRLGTLSMGDTGLVLGRIVKPGDGKAVVTGTADGKPFRREYPVSVSPPEDQNQFLPRLWAKAHIDALRAQMGLGTPKHDAYLKDQIIATSLRYQIMSPFTAFLVLESEEDYERFGVVRRMRMVDWKGELEGVSHAAPAVAKPKPRARAPSRLDWRMVLLPEPSLNLTPTSSVQEVMESLKLLPESVKEAAQTSLSTALRGIGIIGGTAGGGGGGGEDLNGGELEGDERWAKFARGSLTAPIFDRIAEENDSGQLITETEAQTDWTGSVHGRAKQSSAEDADFSDFLGEEGEKAEVRITRGGDLKKAGELAFDGEGGGGDFLDYSVEPPGTPLSGPMPADGLFDGTELDEIDAHFLGSGERLVIPSPYESRLHRWSPRRIASYQYSEGQWLGSYLHRYAVTEIEAGNGEKLRIDPAWRDQGYLRRMAMAARSGSPFPHPRPPGADEGYLRRAVMGRPESSQARLDMFLVLLRSGKCKAALKELDTLLQAVNSPHLWLERAWVLNQAGDKDGAYESVQKAGSLVGPAPDPQPGALQERVAQELATLGRHAEVARLFEALADAAKSENPSARWYSRAFSSAQSAGEKNPEALWERATKKWPQSASVHSQAARSLESLNPELAAKYADKARELGGDTFRLRISILFNQKKADEAWKMLEQAFQAAQNGSEAHVRLYDCQQRDRRRAMQWAEQALEKGAGPQMEGAVQAVNSYDISPRARERVLELALQDNFPANLRITAFHIAHHQGHRNEKWAEILFPLFRNTETAEGRQQALSALQQLANYGYYRLAAPYLESLSALKLENESSQVQLAQARYQIEWNTGNRNEAVDHLEAAFRVCKDENHAYNLANTLIYPLIEQGEAERAVRVVTDMFTRFPAYPNNRYLYQNLAQNLRSRGQLGLLADFRRKVAEAEGTAKTKALLDERRLILEGLKDKKYGEVAGQLRGFEQTLGKEEQELAAAIRGAVAELKELAEKRAAAKPETAPAAGQPAPKPPEPDAAELELRKALDDRLLEFDTLTGLLRNVKALQVRIAALDATVRASFLAECAERAKSEDPVWREWTQARLACLRLSGQPEAYVQALEALNQSEPQDPLWPRLLANAYTTGGETEKARDLLDKLCQADPEEVSYALSRHGLVEASGDREAVEAARNDLWQALRPKPSLLYQLAQDWQRQGKTDLAVDAYMALMEMPGYQDNPWYLLQAGNILQGSGQREQAIRTYLRVFEKAGWASNQGYSAVESLRNLMNDEALLLIVEKEVPKLLESKETPIRAYGLLLAYHTAKLRNKAQDARNHLDALRQVSFKEAPNLAQPVVALLATEREYDWLTEYLRSAAAELKDYALQNVLQSAASALQSFLKDNPKALEATMEIVRLARSPDSGMNPSAQNQLLSNLASWLGQQKETRDKAIAIYRELLRTGDPNATYQAYQVVNWLIDDGKFSEALEEVRRFPLGQNDWNGWNAYDRATRHIGYDKHDWGLAMRVAQECWKRLEGDLQGYGGSAFDRFIEMGWQALENKSLPQDLRDTLTQEVLAYGKACFDGDPGRTGLRGGHLAHCIRDLGLAEQFRKMAEEAGQSDNPQRVLNAAQFTLQTASNLWDRKDNFDLAVKSFRRLLQMEGASRDQKVWACSSLYTLYTNYKDKEWDNAIEVLETWKDAGGLDRRSYLLNRTCCLYGLKRTEDARKAVRELLQMPDYRRNYWSAENLARYCREGADYAMEVECWEHAIRWMRLSRQIRPEYVSQFYVALAGAYRNLGEKERSYETFLRGMSLLNRNTQTHYYQQLMNSLMEFLKQEVQGGLEAMVAHYEKNMRQKGEMPHLRITFGAAYRQEGNERKALQQFEIAARLMPQDTALRKEVVDGYQRLGENGLAEAALLAWAQLDPQNIDLYKSLGGLYDKMSVPDKALRAFATMAEVRPREAEGHRAYGQELVARKMPEQAVIAYEKAVRYRPTEFAIADELASLCRQTEGQTPEQRNARIEGLWTGGESACRQAMEDLPDDPLPWLNLARFLNAQGRKSEAKDLVSEILARQWPRFARETREEAGQILGTLR
jgi:Tfp pilus assembly protein PilF